jgi:hypothetical protein
MSYAQKLSKEYEALHVAKEDAFWTAYGSRIPSVSPAPAPPSKLRPTTTGAPRCRVG